VHKPKHGGRVSAIHSPQASIWPCGSQGHAVHWGIPMQYKLRLWYVGLCTTGWYSPTSFVVFKYFLYRYHKGV